MNLSLEASLSCRLLALLVLALFYGIYLTKQWRQKRRGIKTMQIGSRTDAQTRTVERLTGMFTVFAIVMLHRQILQEERYLTAAFGEEYRAYQRRVLRYLGRRA